MGVTISYRGSLADTGRVEDFEDRVLDLALEIGGQARVWRSVDDDDPRRVVRGLMLNLYPGQETTSLLKQERLHRAIEERRARDDKTGDALLAAMRDEGLIDLPGEPSLSEAARELLEAEEAEEDEPWRDSLPDAIRDPGEDASDDWLGDDERHPLLERVMDLNQRLYDLAAAADERQNDNFRSLRGAAGEMLGGLAQALGSPDFEPPSGLSLVQLKRALRGAAFAFGMLFPLRADGFLNPAEFDELSAILESLQTDIYAELVRLREAREPE